MTAEELAFVVPPEYRYMERREYTDGVKQMLADLERLAREDGCVAAAWALSMFREIPRP